MEQQISEIDFDGLVAGRTFFPSPAAWEDEVLYFLMLDRFSDGRENHVLDNSENLVTTGSTPPFQSTDRGNAAMTMAQRQKWFDAGGGFVGGTLRGLETKIGYLSRLGITAIWISPVFRQVASQDTYHGYGIQNFLDIDPRFGTRDDLVSVVRTAHEHGIRVILDVILNHTGDVFEYRASEFRCNVVDDQGHLIRKEPCWQADGTTYGVEGYRDAAGRPTIPFGSVGHGQFPDGAIWPAELQPAQTFTRKGKIRNWDFEPEFREGDFESLKDNHQGDGGVDEYRPSAAMLAMCKVFKFWIALTDIDGFRVDTVKHMDDGASRLFTSSIHEFAQSLGKENFYLIGEITGGRQRAFNTLEITGMNAALEIDDIQDKIEYLLKGFRQPRDYFDLFRNSLLVRKESHVWFRNKVVTTFDDHDQVRKGRIKSRFAHDEGLGQVDSFRGSLAVLSFLCTTMGIPCIYYGSEQQFDGHGDNDRYIRESMFGGEFGAFESRNVHFFNENNAVYQELSKVLKIRRDNLVIRRGRQFLRQISGDGQNFGFPEMLGGVIRSVVPWSRIFNDREVVLAVNTDFQNTQTAWITINNSLHNTGALVMC
jgi:glycosidase